MLRLIFEYLKKMLNDYKKQISPYVILSDPQQTVFVNVVTQHTENRRWIWNS